MKMCKPIFDVFIAKPMLLNMGNSNTLLANTFIEVYLLRNFIPKYTHVGQNSMG